MSHVLIGGAARCGKSTLSREIRRSTDLQTISGDAFRTTLRKTVARGIFPILHAPRAEKILDEQDFINHHAANAAVEIEAKRAQAKFVWPFIERYIQEVEHESEDGVLVESIDVWPDLIATSGLIHRAAFLVDTSADSQAERIIASRDNDPYDWMHQNNYSDGRIKAWSEFNAQRSVMIRDMANEEGYLCVDLAETPFAEGQLIAKTHLLES
jgi:2-phosphoglycerate kinase